MRNRWSVDQCFHISNRWKFCPQLKRLIIRWKTNQQTNTLPVKISCLASRVLIFRRLSLSNIYHKPSIQSLFADTTKKKQEKNKNKNKTKQKKHFPSVITSLALTQLVVQVQVSKPRYSAEPLVRFHTKNSLAADMHVQIYRCLNEANKSEKEKPFEFHCF